MSRQSCHPRRPGMAFLSGRDRTFNRTCWLIRTPSDYRSHNVRTEDRQGLKRARGSCAKRAEGCGGDPQVADAPDEPEVELTEEEIKAEQAYVRTTRSH